MHNENAQRALSTLQAAKNAVETKTRIMEERRMKEETIKKKLAHVDEDGDTVERRGCGICSLFFRQGSKYSIPSEILNRNKATTQLQLATEQLQQRTEALQQRVDQARANAVTLNMSGKKAEALVALRKSKIIEKQLLSSQNALETLESQLLMIEEAKLQSTISSALTASTGAVRRKTKGLVSKTEKAVDAAIEVRDMSEDVGAAMDGLRPTDGPDEDDLMEELEAMMKPATVEGVAAVQQPSSATITVSFPTAPSGDVSGRVERQGLLASHA